LSNAFSFIFFTELPHDYLYCLNLNFIPGERERK